MLSPSDLSTAALANEIARRIGCSGNRRWKLELLFEGERLLQVGEPIEAPLVVDDEHTAGE